MILHGIHGLRIRWRQYEHGGVRQHWFGPHNVVVVDIVSGLGVAILLGFMTPFPKMIRIELCKLDD